CWYDVRFINKTEEDMYNIDNGREAAPTEVAFDQNGSMLHALDTKKNAQDEGVAPIVGRTGGKDKFVSGQSAITLDSTATLRQILTEVDGRFEVGTAYFPALSAEDEGGVSIGGASLWMIESEDEAKKDATWD